MVLFLGTFNAVRWRYWCSNERNWLIALNSFIMVSGMVLAASAISLVLFTRYATDQEPEGTDSTVYNTSVALAIMGCFQTLVAIMGIVAADKAPRVLSRIPSIYTKAVTWLFSWERVGGIASDFFMIGVLVMPCDGALYQVSLHIMVGYFWLVSLVIGSMFMWSIAALDFHFNFKVWLNHHWEDPALTNVRNRLCRDDTADDECAVPMAGFPLGSPDLWCQAKYNSTDCQEIKEEAVDQAFHFLSIFMTVAGGLSVSSVVEMLASLVLTVRVVTVPIIMRSMQSMINYLMVFPVVGTIVVGYTQSLHRPMLEVIGLVDLHYVVGALLMFLAVMGVIAGHLRHHLLLQVYMAGLCVVLLLYVVLISLAGATWARLWEGFDPEETTRVACEVGVYGCCCCTWNDMVDYTLYSVPGCPEWSDPQELAEVAIVFVKLGLVTCILSVVFVVCGLWASVVFNNNLKGYQVDYI